MDEDGEREGYNEETGDGNNDGGDTGGNSFTEKWGYIKMIDIVSETTKDSWDKVSEYNVFQFFNIFCYYIDKTNEQKRQMDEWKRSH
jgi:hypothetical protein